MKQKIHKPLLLASLISAALFSGSISAAPLAALDVASLEHEGKQLRMVTESGQHVRIDMVSSAVFRIQASNNDQFQSIKVDALRDQCHKHAFHCDAKGEPQNLPDIVIGDEQGDIDYTVSNQGDYHLIQTSKLALRIYHSPLTFALYKADNQTQLWQEVKPIEIGAAVDGFERGELKLTEDDKKTVQTLTSDPKEHFYGGGQQNGEFEFNGKILKASYSGGWEEFDRPSPAPFYMSDKGYGVMHHTWRNGAHDFRALDQLVSSYNEDRFDAYYFVGDSLGDIVNEYTKLTGRPHLLSRWAYYLGDADCYENKVGSYPEGWPADPGSTIDVVKQVGVPYKTHDMPVGWILPNDGYGCGYSDLKGTIDELDELGIKTGLWTEKSLNKIDQEVTDGIGVYKLDVAWTGSGKLYALAANDSAHDGLMRNSETRGMIWTVRGWAGIQRYAVTWTGDQAASWDYIRWHIPTFIGSGLSGQAYASSDVNGIFGHGVETFTRDVQFKAFTPVLISMSGWAKEERKHAWWHDGEYNGKKYRDINRKFLMLKSQLMPYMYTYAYEADQTGAPLMRAMIWEFPDDPRLKSEEFKYQYMYGESLLVAPVYQPMAQNNGWYKGLYLPEGEWVDFWDGTRTTSPEGGMELAHYPITIDKIPVLVRAGAIIPMYQGARSDALQAKDHLIVQLYPHGESSFTLFEDDGETRAYKENNAYAETQITATAPVTGENGDISITINPATVHKDYDGLVTERSYHFQVFSLVKPLGVDAGGATLTELDSLEALESAQEGWYFDATDRHGLVHVKVGKQSVYQTYSVTLDIDEGADVPQTAGYPEPSYVTEFDKSQVTVVKPLPEQENHEFTHALDGDVESLYHSPWEQEGDEDKVPMDFVLQLGGSFNVSGLTYLPRENAGNGTITEYRVYLSSTNGDWGEPVAEGEWPKNKELKIAQFAEQEASFVKFEVVKAVGDFVSAREFDLIATKKRTPTKKVVLTEDRVNTQGDVVVGSAVNGGEMTMNGVTFESGIGMEAPATAEFSLDGSWTRLNADVGIDDSCKVADNKVKALIYADGAKIWEFELSGPAVVKPDIDLFNIRKVSLQVVNSDNSDVGDCVNWANLKLTGPETASFNDFDRYLITFVEKPKAQPSEEIEKAFDGDVNTMYHSPWKPKDDSEKAPQHFVIELGQDYMVNGFTYQARPGAGNGAIGDYRLSLSEDGDNFNEVASGEFEKRDGIQAVQFEKTKARYLKFEALNGTGGFISAAEFGVIAERVISVEPDLPTNPETPTNPDAPSAPVPPVKPISGDTSTTTQADGGSAGGFGILALAVMGWLRRRR